MNKLLKFFFLILFFNIFFICQYYKNVFKKFSNVKLEKKHAKDKLVRYKCVRSYCGGLSDRLRGISSAWALAKLTGRRLELNIEKPCSLGNYFLPNKLNWSLSGTGNKTLFQMGPRHPVLKNLSKLNINKFFDKYDIIELTNFNVILIPLLNKNPFFQTRIKELGYSSNNFTYQTLVKIVYFDLFKLGPRLQHIYDKFLDEAKPTNETKLICAQVRIGGTRPNVVHDKQFMSINNTIYFWKFINETFIHKMNLSDFRIFVTSDTQAMHEEARGFFSDRKMVHIAGDYIHIDRTLVRKKDCFRADKVYLDFHAMQNCDMAVIGSGGFGFSGMLIRPEPFKNLYRHSNKKFRKL